MKPGSDINLNDSLPGVDRSDYNNYLRLVCPKMEKKIEFLVAELETVL